MALIPRKLSVVIDAIFPANTLRRRVCEGLFVKCGGIKFLNALAERRNRQLANLELENNFAPFSFAASEKPEVSIVIPVFNKFKYTYTCLKTVFERTREIGYEVIIVDNASTDKTSKISSLLKNLKIIRNASNEGFVAACNAGAAAAKGQYLLFLNNDTKVREGWLKAMLDLAKKDEKIGIVGAKLVYPNGQLQEAGGIIWNDPLNMGWNFGKFSDPDSYEFNYVKDVDFASGACLLVKKDLFEKIGGFDTRYAPAYCEDVDLAFSARKLGYKVVYQPLAEIVHFEGITAGTDIAAGLKSYQPINQKKFVEKWKDVLERHHFKNGENVFFARDRSYGKKVILFIDHYVPTPDKDAGSLAAFMYIKLCIELGFKIIFVPDNLYKMEPYTMHLQQMGVEVLCGPVDFKKWLELNGKHIDYAWLARPHVALKHFDALKEYTKAKIFYWTVDLHFLREMRRYEVERDEKLLQSAEEIKKKELDICSRVDGVISYSEIETKIINELLPDKLVITVPLFFYSEMPCDKYGVSPFHDRKDILFLGGFNHTPNIDAVKYFVSEVFPIIKKKLPDIKLYVAGSNPPDEIKELAADDIVIVGFVDDLSPYFKAARVFVCPLRYGAGIKGKIITSMTYGLPIVTTTIGNEGICLVDGVDAAIADGPVEFANRTIELYSDAHLWQKFSSNAITFANKRYSKNVAKRLLLDGFKIILEKCIICGTQVNFSPSDCMRNLRESEVCPVCGALMRHIDIAQCIMKSFGIAPSSSLAESMDKFKDLHIYELAHAGAIHRLFSKLPNYISSEYFDGVTPGGFHSSGIRSEDVQALTFKDASFDLVISQDVFEHVPDPEVGFKEICRVLKTGGYHIFTIPFHKGMSKSVTRAAITNGNVRHLSAPAYHGDPIRREGALVFTDFGDDVVELNKSIGFEMEIYESSHRQYMGGYNAVFIAKKCR